MNNVAHIIKEENLIQTIDEHNKNVAMLSSNFASKFNQGLYCYLSGLYHDIGKTSDEFGNRIINNGRKCDHSSAGLQFIYDKNNPITKIIGHLICSHHSGLLNSDNKYSYSEKSLYGRLNKHIPNYIRPKPNPDILNKLSLEFSNTKPENLNGFYFFQLIHMLFSCLVDADYIDTESFMNQCNRNSNNIITSKLLCTANNYINKFGIPTNEINILRTNVLNDCISFSKNKRGFYTQRVPTGGGKTISSLLFSLNHAINNNMDRIIYVIPYTSIIEQNAKVFEDIVGSKHVLQHHCNYDFTEDDIENNKNLYIENWDSEIIVTTNVQFFESLFSNRTSKNRKLHNIANSVIIFDEAQMLPVNYLLPCLNSLEELVNNYNCSVVLSSATQPHLDKYLKTKPIEIVKNQDVLDEKFKRTNIKFIGEKTIDDICLELQRTKQSLIIVNTKRHAEDLFYILNNNVDTYYLSTNLCPIHISNIIKEIKYRLKNNLECTVISTRLIEAGVDIDFPVVYRSLCGIDSIIQSAGRCNREGKLTDMNGNLVKGNVYVFIPEREYVKSTPKETLHQASITLEVIDLFDDITNKEATDTYFNKLYSSSNLDEKNILKRINNGFNLNTNDIESLLNYQFEDISNDFKLLEDETIPIYIPYDDEAVHLINILNNKCESRNIHKKLQQYSVNVYKNKYIDLVEKGIVNDYNYIYGIMNDIRYYDSKVGIKREYERVDLFL